MSVNKYPVRTSVKAIILRDDHVLLIKFSSKSGYWYGLPGGGQNRNESLAEAVTRECKEEVDASIAVGDLVFVRDYIADHHEFKIDDDGFHQVEFMFRCYVENNYHPVHGKAPDENQISVEWVEFKNLPEINLFPSDLKHLIPKLGSESQLVYMGDVN